MYIYCCLCFESENHGYCTVWLFFGFFIFFFVIRTQDSILLNLNPNGHIVEAKIEISLFNPILLMNSDKIYLPKYNLSLFISNSFAPIIAPLLELVFFNLASKFSFLLHCWRCSKDYWVFFSFFHFPSIFLLRSSVFTSLI